MDVKDLIKLIAENKHVMNMVIDNRQVLFNIIDPDDEERQLTKRFSTHSILDFHANFIDKEIRESVWIINNLRQEDEMRKAAAAGPVFLNATEPSEDRE